MCWFASARAACGPPAPVAEWPACAGRRFGTAGVGGREPGALPLQLRVIIAQHKSSPMMALVRSMRFATAPRQVEDARDVGTESTRPAGRSVRPRSKHPLPDRRGLSASDVLLRRWSRSYPDCPPTFALFERMTLPLKVAPSRSEQVSRPKGRPRNAPSKVESSISTDLPTLAPAGSVPLKAAPAEQFSPTDRLSALTILRK